MSNTYTRVPLFLNVAVSYEGSLLVTVDCSSACTARLFVRPLLVKVRSVTFTLNCPEGELLLSSLLPQEPKTMTVARATIIVRMFLLKFIYHFIFTKVTCIDCWRSFQWYKQKMW